MAERQLHAATEGAVPPHDLKAEQATLGSMLLSKQYIDEVLLILTEADFFFGPNRLTFSVIRSLRAAGEPVDPIVIGERLRKLDVLEKFEDVGGVLYLHRLLQAPVAAASATHYASIVRECSRRRLIQNVGDRMSREALNGGDSGQIISRAIDELERQCQPGAIRLEPLDWERLKHEGVPSVTTLLDPYVINEARIWIFGPAESSKTLWAQVIAAELTRAGHCVAFFSSENPLAEDARRLERLRPEWSRFLFFHDSQIDLADASDVAAILEATRGCALVVFDTLTACWSGKESDNEEITALDRNVLQRFTRAGSSVLIVHHTGHPQAFVSRRGVNAGRGASAQAQKADVVLEFKPAGERTFQIIHAKARLGGVKQPPTTYRVVDRADGGLGIEITEVATEGMIDVPALRALALEILDAKPGSLTKTALAQELGCRKDDALSVVGSMLRDGLIGPDKPRALLRIVRPEESLL